MSRLIEYLAGFFDGEGSISLHEIRSKVRIRVSQVGEEPLNLYAKVFGGTVRFQQITSGFLPYYNYDTNDSIRCGKILMSLYPYLLVKQEKAQIALKRLGLSVPTSSDTVSTEYLAGFFDAEGSVSTAVKEGNKIAMNIRVRQNNPYPLLMFKEMYGGYVYENKTPLGKESYEWKLRQSDVTYFCNEMIPHSIIKHEQLKLAKKLVSILLHHGGRDPRIEEKLTLAIEIKLLNSRADLRAETMDMFAE